MPPVWSPESAAVGDCPAVCGQLGGGRDTATPLQGSVADPDPPDPRVFGPPGSGSINQRYGSGSGSFYLSLSNNGKKNLDFYFL
jgi:hypothetical protein